ncbi:MAG: TRIC cation channel family protein [Clostridia bacterium]|nr:TRIC cation channel family protein [Clostridia bacterium]
MQTYIFIMELIGSVAFAISGAIKALHHKMDLFGVCVLGLVTAVGGGVIRDIVIGQTPPMVFQNPVYAMVALVVSLLVFWLAPHTPHTKEGEKILYAADSIGLAVFTAVGVEGAYVLGYNRLTIWLFVGIITGVGGGVLRDVFTGTIPHIFRKHIYATASLVGVLVIWLCNKWMGFMPSLLIGAAVIIVIRTMSMLFHLNLPKSSD